MPNEQGFFQNLTKSNFGNAVTFGSQVAGIVGLGINIYKLFTDKQDEIIDKLDAIQGQITALESRLTELIEQLGEQIWAELLDMERREVVRGLRNVSEQISQLMNARAHNRDFGAFQSTASELTRSGITLLQQRRDPSCDELIPLQVEVATTRIAFLSALPLETRIGLKPHGGLDLCAELLRESTENLANRIMARHAVSSFRRVEPTEFSEGELEYFVRKTLSWKHTHCGWVVNDFVYRIIEEEKSRGDRIPRMSIENPMTEQEAHGRSLQSMQNGMANELGFVGIPRWRELANEWDEINSRIWTNTITYDGRVIDSTAVGRNT